MDSLERRRCARLVDVNQYCACGTRKKILGIPDELKVIALTPLGEPDEVKESKERKSLEEIVRWGKYGGKRS